MNTFTGGALCAVLLALCAYHGHSRGSLVDADDSALASLYGGACMQKSQKTCGRGGGPGCVETLGFKLSGSCNHKATASFACGSFACGDVLGPVPVCG